MQIQPSSEYSELYETCTTYPAIDNHAHPILKVEYRNEITYQSIWSDADPESLALQDSIYTLAGYRATTQLAGILGIKSKDVTWEKVRAAAREMDYNDLCHLCFRPAHIQCILFDYGLGGALHLGESYHWHNRYTTSPNKKIVRIEVVAEEILIHVVRAMEADEIKLTTREILTKFDTGFKDAISAAIKDPEVVAFKSIACYRTGLNISTTDSLSDIVSSLEDALSALQRSGDDKIRLASKAFNDHFVRMVLSVSTKPVQFHTGLGDPSLLLSTATPSLMQPIIRAYPLVTFVLLHASYPFTREAGYLVAMHHNVYLDFGEIFPQISADGQRSIIRQTLELCPTNKVMWSTDGHWMPETFVLGSLQAREAIFAVLKENVLRGELTERLAVEIVKKMLFGNANKVYALGLEPIFAA
ncbi:hypothetical protein HWV62_38186 [Athelia sp. TMB]|nr:hypothetical protein HWV62_33555 [Athelia sp. TMB]KAF7980390.1 hypothetical protein HWV62_38186 [Athelia sp. TMB]